MISVISMVVGFLSSAVPQLMKFFQDRQDKKHELEVLKLQMERERLGHTYRLEEIDAEAVKTQMESIYSYADAKQASKTGNKWVDGFSALMFTLNNSLISTVRPIVTYAIFSLYAYQKSKTLAWTEMDTAIFSTIIGFWFGSRMMQRFYQK